MTTEKQKMLAGELYDPDDAELCRERARCHALCKALSDTRDDDQVVRQKLVTELMGHESDVWIEPPFFCDYGYNISLGSKVYFNCNCVVLDVMPVTIGSHVLFGPAVQIYTALHPMNAEMRRTRELAQSVSIGSDVWVGGGAIICPGVKIGERSVIGAGSVVTRGVPADVFAAGNPCRIIRDLPQ